MSEIESNKKNCVLPNLKICIENAEESENEEISFSDKDDYSFIDEPYSHRVEFSVRINNNNEKNTQHKFGIEPKKYGNKDGDFVTGIDITKKEEAEKREERARRFGLEESQNDNNQPNQQVDIASLYKSLGIHEADVPKDERGIRLEAVHIRGVRNMSTKDVFEYFQEFAPSNVEWIEDNSCNVVWADGLSAARALYKLSRSYEDVCAATAGGVSVGARTLPDITKGVLGRDRRRTKQEEHHDDDEEEEDDSSSSDTSQDNPTSSPGGGEGGGSGDGGGSGGKEEEEEEEKEGDPSDNDGGAADCQPADQPQQSPEEVDQQQPMEEGEVEEGEVDDDGEGAQAEDKEAEEPEEVPPRPAEPKSDGELSSSEDDEADRAESEEKKNNNVSSTFSVNCPEGGSKSPAVGFTNDSIDVSADSNEIQWPPGKWRLGKSCPQANRLFMRYATKADRKLPGAEKRSQYYMKYGNPNYGGLRGLISNSRKRKIRSVKSKDDVNDSRGHKNDEGHRRKNSSGLDTLDNSDLSDSDSSCSEIEPASRVSPPATKHRMMRMYADDIEEELKAKRSGRSRLAHHRMGLKLSQYGGAGGASLVKDARQLISRSDKSHHHHHHQYSRIHDDDEEEDIEDDDGDGDDLGSRHHRFSSSVSPYNTKSDLRAKLERKRMRLSSPSSSSSALSSSNAALSSASSNYLRLKIEVLD